MLTFREKYWRYSLFALIVGFGVTIFIELTPFLGGLMGASTIYVLLRGQMRRLSEVRGWRRSMAATLLLVEAVLLFLIPASLVGWMFVVKVQELVADPHAIIDPLRQIAQTIRLRTGYDVWQEENLLSVIGTLPRIGQMLVGGIVNFGVNIVVLLFVLYFMLIGGRRMEQYCREIMPFSRSVSRSVMREVWTIVRSNALGIPLLAAVQGVVAYVGYVLFGVSGALFWGVATCCATIIPIFGTALVWLPLAGFLALDGRWGAAVGLLLYGTLIVTHVDNVARFVMQKKLADTHPLITIFGVFVGLPLFGFMGVIFGPLLLAMFVFFVDLFKRHYLDGTSRDEVVSRMTRMRVRP